MKAHLAYLTATRYLFAEKHHTTERKATQKEKARMTRPEVVARRLGGVRHAFWLVAARMSGSGDDLQRGP